MQAISKLPLQLYAWEFEGKMQPETVYLYFHLQKQKRVFYSARQACIKDLQQNQYC